MIKIEIEELVVKSTQKITKETADGTSTTFKYQLKNNKFTITIQSEEKLNFKQGTKGVSVDIFNPQKTLKETKK